MEPAPTTGLFDFVTSTEPVFPNPVPSQDLITVLPSRFDFGRRWHVGQSGGPVLRATLCVGVMPCAPGSIFFRPATLFLRFPCCPPRLFSFCFVATSIHSIARSVFFCPEALRSSGVKPGDPGLRTRGLYRRVTPPEPLQPPSFRDGSFFFPFPSPSVSHFPRFSRFDRLVSLPHL